MARRGFVGLTAALVVIGCAPRDSLTYVGGQPINLHELTAGEVAREVQITIRLDNGEAISTTGAPAYVQGYMQAVDAYRSGAAAPAS